MSSRSPGIAIIAAASLTVLIWGATPAVTKLAVGTFDVLSVALMRTVFAVPIALAIILCYRLPLPATAKERALLVASSGSGLIGSVLFLTIGMRLTTANHGALILAALPLFTGLIAALVEWRPLGVRWWIGSGVALAGEAALVLRGGELGAGGMIGDGMVLVAAFFSSAGYVFGARLAQAGYPSRYAVLWNVVIAGIVLAPLLIWTADWPQFIAADLAGWGSIAYLVLGSTLLAYGAWIWALGRGGIARVGLAQYFQPPVGVLASLMVLGEPVTLPLVIAGAMIVAGVVVATRR
ncbi:MAG: DMT family transporter [Proteobacteria bacterium]|nr:DMT family transporter [Pseudomonadota bacterium]MBI3505662.1 DMT family transporter [Pseudomonadota bacterium]